MEQTSSRYEHAKKLITAITAATLAATVGVAPAFASTYSAPNSESSITNASSVKYITAAATRAAMPAPELLGISNVEDSANFVDVANPLTTSDSFPSARFVLLGSGLASPDNPYYANYNYNTLNNGTSSNAVAINPGRAGDGQGPNASLDEYGADSTDDAVWNMLPDIIIGTGGTTNYAAEAAAAGTANGNSSYSPTVLPYSFSVNEDMIQSMYSIAQAADQTIYDASQTVTTSDDRALRFSVTGYDSDPNTNALETALAYERYVKGTQGYVLSQLEANHASQKKVALVYGQNNDGTYKILESGIQDGTASTNRYLEAVEAITTNLADEVDDVNAVTLTDLQSCAAVLIGGQNGVDAASIASSLSGCPNVYYATNSSVGAMYGTVMNSPENAQNIGRIIGFVYPEYVDQVNFTAYYWETFYNIAAGNLGTVMAGEMDGNVTLASAQTWAPASTYSAANVNTAINTGCSYILGHMNSVPTTLQPTAYLLDNVASFSIPTTYAVS